jgi:hypothetical protein
METALIWLLVSIGSHNIAIASGSTSQSATATVVVERYNTKKDCKDTLDLIYDSRPKDWRFTTMECIPSNVLIIKR